MQKSVEKSSMGVEREKTMNSTVKHKTGDKYCLRVLSISEMCVSK